MVLIRQKKSENPHLIYLNKKAIEKKLLLYVPISVT